MLKHTPLLMLKHTPLLHVDHRFLIQWNLCILYGHVKFTNGLQCHEILFFAYFLMGIPPCLVLRKRYMQTQAYNDWFSLSLLVHTAVYCFMIGSCRQGKPSS
jgi:hypothetical protein